MLAFDVPVDVQTRMPLVAFQQGDMVVLPVMKNQSVSCRLTFEIMAALPNPIPRKKQSFVVRWHRSSSAVVADAFEDIDPGYDLLQLHTITQLDIGSFCCGLALRTVDDIASQPDTKIIVLMPDVHYGNTDARIQTMQRDISGRPRYPESRPMPPDVAALIGRAGRTFMNRGGTSCIVHPFHDSAVKAAGVIMTPLTLDPLTKLPADAIHKRLLRYTLVNESTGIVEYTWMFVNHDRVYACTLDAWTEYSLPDFSAPMYTYDALPDTLQRLIGVRVSGVDMCFVGKKPPYKYHALLNRAMFQRYDDVRALARSRAAPDQVIPQTLCLLLNMHGAVNDAQMIKSKGQKMRIWVQNMHGYIGEYTTARPHNIIKYFEMPYVSDEARTTLLDFEHMLDNISTADSLDMRERPPSSVIKQPAKVYSRASNVHSIVNKTYSDVGSDRGKNFPSTSVMTMNTLVDDDRRVLLPIATDLTELPDFIAFVRSKTSEKNKDKDWKGCDKIGSFTTKHILQFLARYGVKNLFLIDVTCSKLDNDGALSVSLHYRSNYVPTAATSAYAKEDLTALRSLHAEKRAVWTSNLISRHPPKSISVSGGRCRRTARQRRRLRRRYSQRKSQYFPFSIRE